MRYEKVCYLRSRILSVERFRPTFATNIFIFTQQFLHDFVDVISVKHGVVKMQRADQVIVILTH